MVAILVFAFFIAVGLVLLLARYSPHPAHAEEAARQALDKRPRMDAGRLRTLTTDLLSALGLQVVEEE